MLKYHQEVVTLSVPLIRNGCLSPVILIVGCGVAIVNTARSKKQKQLMHCGLDVIILVITMTGNVLSMVQAMCRSIALSCPAVTPTGTTLVAHTLATAVAMMVTQYGCCRWIQTDATITELISR